MTLALLVGIIEVLGTFSLFTFIPTLVVSVAVGVGLRVVAGRGPPGRRSGPGGRRAAATIPCTG